MRPTVYVAAALGLASPICVVATDPLTADKVEADITTTGLQRVLWNLNKIARDHGGNRAFGTPGYKASVDFVLERAQQRFGKEMDTHLHPFSYWFEDLRRIKVTGPAGEDVRVLSPQYNVAGDIKNTPLVDTPVDDANGSGCLPEQWTGIDATGKLALIKRGTCAVSQKLALAKQHGAVGAIVWNNRPGDAIISLTLGAENRGTIVPVGIITQEVGLAWKARLAAGEQVLVSLLVDNSYDVRESWNVISETKEGDPNKVVMIGAHLDSVIQGAGTNDDGSGSSAVLEIMGSIKKYKGFPHKIRFAWWGAEESGLIGSKAYTKSLNTTQADAIRYYFNYDMIGSVNPMYELARNKLSGIGPVLLSSYLESKGKPVTYADFDDGSDYASFVALGIPTASIYTGEDPCYHQACDTIDNIDWDALTTNAKAAGRALATLALSLDGVPPRAPPAARRNLADVSGPSRRAAMSPPRGAVGRQGRRFGV
ncbi:hypothetical protein GGTG_10957 [Gaeumannomyces tritici R3-111a-1]|uniref:Peptide hydrolase n=1 Tax=Gaeumannomyces tritici (strain R3-111a-1) TaxID=644352 RepID=J3PBT6_GAET3|nr:hypothetical protein GGTG_10957 [Gaeumannomyces tritici R3-111a-1]EJT71703.1 hypothetical protein GGTG_10957 [Gaeumannomyces tritici R3-111a-1]